MAQATFPEGISDDIPEEKSLVEKVIEGIIGPMRDFFEGMGKINDHAAAGRREDCEH